MFCTVVTPFLITFELPGQLQMDLTERTENSKIITLLQSSRKKAVKQKKEISKHPDQAKGFNSNSDLTEHKFKASFRPHIFLENISRDMQTQGKQDISAFRKVF